jgi:O-antigen/teichoic acid export membrane protein
MNLRVTAYERALAAMSAIFFVAALIFYIEGERIFGDTGRAVLSYLICAAIGGLLLYMAASRHWRRERS